VFNLFIIVLILGLGDGPVGDGPGEAIGAAPFMPTKELNKILGPAVGPAVGPGAGSALVENGLELFVTVVDELVGAELPERRLDKTEDAGVAPDLLGAAFVAPALDRLTGVADGETGRELPEKTLTKIVLKNPKNELSLEDGDEEDDALGPKLIPKSLKMPFSCEPM